MALVADTVTVGTDATLLCEGYGKRSQVTVYNGDAADIFVGPSDVTTSTGIPVAKSTSASFPTTDALYAISAAGTTTGAVRVLELRRF